MIVQSKVPRPACARPAQRKYPLYDMQIDDSFLVVIGQHETVEMIRGRLNSSIRSVGRYIASRFSMRTMADGIRVWRVA